MKNYIFIADTYQKAGLGHLRRCLKYSEFIREKNKIYFLINNLLLINFLKNKNFHNKKIKFIFFSNLKKKLNSIKNKNKGIIIFLDTYNKKILNLNLNLYCEKLIALLDFKLKNKADIVLDHTFLREKNFHLVKNKNVKTFMGHNYFPIKKLLKHKKKKLVLINFGSVKNNELIRKSILFVKKLDLDARYKIIIVNKFFRRKTIEKIKIKHKIIALKFIPNIEQVYSKTFFSIGACGISLYERCFYGIPSIAKPVAMNQKYNFDNFLKKKCILNLNNEMKRTFLIKNEKKKFLRRLNKVSSNLRTFFNLKRNNKCLQNFFQNIES